MSVSKSVSQVTKIASSRKPVLPTEAPQLFVVVSESSKFALTVKDFNYDDAENLGNAGNNFDKSSLTCLFAKIETPTFSGYQESVKARNKTLPVDKRVNVPNSKTHNALFQRFNNVARISEAQELGFEALVYWNNKAITAKRTTVPNLTYVLKGARAFVNGTKAEITAEEKATKQIIALYKTLQDCKGKAWVLAEKQITATMKGLNIELPEIADEVADEE